MLFLLLKLKTLMCVLLLCLILLSKKGHPFLCGAHACPFGLMVASNKVFSKRVNQVFSYVCVSSVSHLFLCDLHLERGGMKVVTNSLVFAIDYDQQICSALHGTSVHTSFKYTISVTWSRHVRPRSRQLSRPSVALGVGWFRSQVWEPETRVCVNLRYSPRWIFCGAFYPTRRACSTYII